ncbi:MAG: hypothetical protein V1834_04605 [Candidatus Micrarchaeota archaeon]
MPVLTALPERKELETVASTAAKKTGNVLEAFRTHKAVREGKQKKPLIGYNKEKTALAEAGLGITVLRKIHEQRGIPEFKELDPKNEEIKAEVFESLEGIFGHEKAGQLLERELTWLPAFDVLIAGVKAGKKNAASLVSDYKTALYIAREARKKAPVLLAESEELDKKDFLGYDDRQRKEALDRELSVVSRNIEKLEAKGRGFYEDDRETAARLFYELAGYEHERKPTPASAQKMLGLLQGLSQEHGAKSKAHEVRLGCAHHEVAKVHITQGHIDEKRANELMTKWKRDEAHPAYLTAVQNYEAAKTHLETAEKLFEKHGDTKAEVAARRDIEGIEHVLSSCKSKLQELAKYFKIKDDKHRDTLR